MNYFDAIIGQAPVVKEMIKTAQTVAMNDITVLIKGETGTGKEILANAIQKQGKRANKPYLTLNCAALPERLIESELFGHKKGSFSGADTHKRGMLQSVDEGTLFLDEIDFLPLGVQFKILRFIEKGECLALGDTKPYKADVRIISATNTNLYERIKLGQFRKDLFYRLHAMTLELPPLKHRTEDINLLASYFMRHFSRVHNLPLASFSQTALNILKGYQWPGNVRELRNLCEKFSILMSGETIKPENLPVEYSNGFSCVANY